MTVATLLRHPKLSVHMRTGAEGPKHDPYHFEELTIHTPGGETILHFGLGDWATHNGVPIDVRGFLDKERVAFLREQFLKDKTGFTMVQIERMVRKMTERCRKCGGREFTDNRGFPGEYFSCCARCGEVVDSYFCQSEIE